MKRARGEVQYSMSPKFLRRLLFSLIFGVIVFFALLFVGDAKKTVTALAASSWRYLPLVLLLACGNYLFRFCRWLLYLRRLRITVPLRQSVTIFMSGLAMSVTPGKFGELIKCYGLKQTSAAPFAQSAAVVFGERFTDLLAVLALAGVGALSFHYGTHVIATSLAILAGLLVLVMCRPVIRAILRMITSYRRLSFLASKIAELYEHTFRILLPLPLLSGILLGALAWFCECLGFWFVLIAVHAPLSLGIAIFIYAFATLFGALTFLPGGLGVTEGSLTGLLVLRDVPKNEAVAAALIIRGATLWFAVLVGLLWYVPNERKLALKYASRDAYRPGDVQ